MTTPTTVTNRNWDDYFDDDYNCIDFDYHQQLPPTETTATLVRHLCRRWDDKKDMFSDELRCPTTCDVDSIPYFDGVVALGYDILTDGFMNTRTMGHFHPLVEFPLVPQSDVANIDSWDMYLLYAQCCNVIRLIDCRAQYVSCFLRPFNMDCLSKIDWLIDTAALDPRLSAVAQNAEISASALYSLIEQSA